MSGIDGEHAPVQIDSGLAAPAAPAGAIDGGLQSFAALGNHNVAGMERPSARMGAQAAFAGGAVESPADAQIARSLADAVRDRAPAGGAILARQGHGEGGAPPSNAPHGGQSGSGPTLDVGTLEDSEKIDALPASIEAGEAITVSGLWTSHSAWPGVAHSNESLFLQSLDLCPELLDAFTDEQESFKRSVEGRAKTHLAENKQYVSEEMAKLGIEADASFEGAGTPEEQAERVGEVKALAVEAQRALRAKQDLLGINVGLGGSEVAEGASGAPGSFSLVTFNPDAKPQMPGDASEGVQATWEEVSAQWNELEATIAHMESTSPALFAVLNQDSLGDDSAKAEEAGALASADDETALAKMESAMRSLQGKLDEVAEGVGSEYEWDDLGLLFPQVLAEEPWTNPIDSAVANRLIKEETASDEAIDTALMAVGIIAALVAVFATGGMAVALMAVGTAAGGAEAVMSVDDYVTKQALRDARTGKKEHDLIEQETVDAAAVKAILDTVFAFIDIVGAAKAIRVTGAVDDVMAKVGKLGELAGAEKESAFKTALDVMGPPKALDAVGGLDAARAQLGAGSASLARAEAYSAQLVEEMGQSLGGKEARERAAKMVGPDAAPDMPPGMGSGAPTPLPPAVKSPEELLKQAQDFAAGKTGLPAERALKVAAPAADSADEVALVMQRAAAAAAQPSEEFVALATADARMAKIHNQAVEWAQQRGIPAPASALAKDGPRLDFEKWTIVYNSKSLGEETASHATWEFLQATGIHEARHAQQWFDMARVALGKNMSEADIVSKLGIPADVVTAAAKKGKLELGKPGFEKVDEFYTSVFGDNAGYRNKVLDELKQHRALTASRNEAWEEAKKLQGKVNAQPPGSPERVALEKEFADAKAKAGSLETSWKKDKPARDANNTAYKNLPEEQDAFNVQAEYGAMLQAKREADAAAKSVVDDPTEVELDESDFLEVTTP